MGTVHSHQTDEKNTPTTVRFALYLLVPVAVATAIAMALMWPTDKPEATSAAGAQEVTGTVTGISLKECPDTGTEPGGEPGDSGASAKPERCGTVTVELTSGADEGDIVTSTLPNGPGAPYVEVGDSVILMHLPEAEFSYSIIDQDRSTPLWILAIAFALAVIAFGRLRGLLSLVGLAVTFAVLLLFIVPAILSGESPLPVAIVGSCAIMLAVLYLTHGFRATTTIAVAGTLCSLVLTGLLSALAVGMAHLTGISDEDTSVLSMYHGVNTEGLLLAGILIGSLGALDDVTVTQASAVSELARANPEYGFGELYSAAARIGRSHIASVVNTIILAYAGAALPLLILIAAADRPLSETLTTQLIAEEIVRGIVGTIGLIAAVPLTTLLAALTVHKFAPPPGVELATPGPRPKRPRNEWLDMHEDETPPPESRPEAEEPR
ncbi:YibE/F family protein [Stackebrandtia nassauensis]|uniref:YibE/F family protein n=1 Tax=Stackebrandtia nassauensis (strain DSM 44728 / CIP 108903 / NRRL B-16338 / NBRC 102104 / LLR-40K-21) TaxID=446470 RepID=D3Q6T1_STANL|nr:YibE/F family protein [Stackebrandtia nassauensis]ADD40330.1 YibE/F family protein [Stackebrandtia nassauensis DSM 44728]